MADEPNVDQRLAISAEAARLIDDTVFNGVLNAITKDYITGLMDSPVGSPQSMTFHAGLNGLKDIKERLNALKGDGAVLRKKLQAEQPKG